MENPTQSDTIEPIEPEKPKRVTKVQKKKLMIESLGNQLGIVSISCKQVGIHRDTHYAWMKEDKKYKQAVEDVTYNLKDFGENALLKLMKNEHPGAIIFFNKTRNKDRGYYEKQEIEHTGEEQPNTFNLIVKSVEEIKSEKLNNQPKAT